MKFAHSTDVETLFLIYVRYLNTVPSALEVIEIISTIPLTNYKSSEQINSALFSRAKRSHRLVKFVKRSPRLVEFSRSPRLVTLNLLNFDLKRCNTLKGFRAFLVHCIFSKIDSFLSVFSKAAFLSFTFFFFRLSIMCCRVFNEQLFYSGLRDINDHNQLVGYLSFISSTPSKNNCE